MIIADQHLVKKMNQKLILNEIIKNAPISKAKISAITGLNKSTISSQVSSLIKGNIIFEIGRGTSSGGRRPIMLMFNKNAGYAIGVDIGVNYINVILSDLEGYISYSCYQDLEETSFAGMREALFTMIKTAMAHIPDSYYSLIGIGIGVPGFVDYDHQVVFTPNTKWNAINLQRIVQDEFNVPVFIENEANAGAYGEKNFGHAKNYENLIYVSVNIGIGIGIIINNQLYRGTKGFSGEMGHMSIDFSGPRCNCGNRGCWEMYASERSVTTSLTETKKMTHFSCEKITELVNQNDIETLNALENFGFFLGIGLTNILNTFDPEIIILRNDLIESHPIILKSIQNTITSRTYREQSDSCKFVISKLGKDSTALGASSIVIKNFLDNFSITD